MGAFERWSYEHLGQSHYLLGFIIVLVTHNWPLLLSLGLVVWCSVRLYLKPDQPWVLRLMAALLLGGVYEYQKHITSRLHEAINMLLHSELEPLNLVAHSVVAIVIPVACYGAIGGFLAGASWQERRRPQPERRAIPGSPELPT